MTKTDHKCTIDASFMILCSGSSRGHCNKYCIACTAADLRLCFGMGKIWFSYDVAQFSDDTRLKSDRIFSKTALFLQQRLLSEIRNRSFEINAVI